MKNILAIVMVVGLSACGGKQSDKVEVDLGWTPQTVKVNCPSGDCPDAAGVLILGRRGGRGYQLARCTATMIAPDTIITNAHCDDSIPDYSHAYFIKAGPSGQSSVVANVIRKTYDKKGEISGIDRDLAIFKLDRAMPGAPKNISRRIPDRMDRLIAYVIDQAYWDSDFQSFDLNKRNCNTKPRMALFAGGTEDKTLGLALFGCAVKQGNSGSAVYVPGDMQNIQGLINTVWTFSTTKSDEVEKVRALFFETPEFMKNDYGMAERLHCADVPDQAPPSEYCTRVDMEDSVGEKFRTAVRARLDQLLNSVAQGPGGIQWTFETIAGETDSSYSRAVKFPTVLLIPVPFCIKSNATQASLSAPYFRMGLLDGAGSEARLLYQDDLSLNMQARAGGLEIRSTWRRGESRPFLPNLALRPRHTELTANFRSQDVPGCTPLSAGEARQAAIESVNRAVRIRDARFMTSPN
jgi:hypothetical protein